MVFIYLLYYVSCDENFSSDCSLLLRIRIVACFGPDVYFVLALCEGNCNIDKISVPDRPNAFILHIVNFKHIFFFQKNFYLHQLKIHLLEGFFLLQKLNYLLHRKFTDVHSF